MSQSCLCSGTRAYCSVCLIYLTFFSSLDYATDNLYVLDAGRRLVEVVSLRSQKRAVVHRFQHQEVPISLCVMPDYG